MFCVSRAEYVYVRKSRKIEFVIIYDVGARCVGSVSVTSSDAKRSVIVAVAGRHSSEKFENREIIYVRVSTNLADC
jgi:hypothetical protein